MFDWFLSTPPWAFFAMTAMYCLGVILGKATKKPPEPKVGTVDELVQSIHDKIGIKTGRDVKVDVAGITCYTAIVTENSVVFVNMDYHEFN